MHSLAALMHLGLTRRGIIPVAFLLFHCEHHW